jgi:hypothetical protein
MVTGQPRFQAVAATPRGYPTARCDRRRCRAAQEVPGGVVTFDGMRLTVERR